MATDASWYQNSNRPHPHETVLYVSSSGDIYGGAERCLVDVTKRIPAHGWKPVVAVPSPGSLAHALLAAGVSADIGELGVLRSRRELRSPRLFQRLVSLMPATLRLARLIRMYEVRIVHSNTSIVLAGALAARLTGKPHVWHVREILDGPGWRILRRLILSLSDRVICISSAVAYNVAGPRAHQDPRLVIIPDGIDLDFFAPPPPMTDRGKLRVVMVGRINPWKGQDLFLRAASLVANRLANVEFFLIGGHISAYDDLYRRLVALKSELGLDGRAHFVEHLDRQAVRNFVSSVDVVVVPSVRPEPGGLVLLEAMALERAVVVTRHGGPLDIIVDGVNGRLVSPVDPAEIADVLVHLLADTPSRRRLGVEARRTVASRYALPHQIDRLNALYREILAGRT